MRQQAQRVAQSLQPGMRPCNDRIHVACETKGELDSTHLALMLLYTQEQASHQLIPETQPQQAPKQEPQPLRMVPQRSPQLLKIGPQLRRSGRRVRQAVGTAQGMYQSLQTLKTQPHEPCATQRSHT
jgi:hypothetical protein